MVRFSETQGINNWTMPSQEETLDLVETSPKYLRKQRHHPYRKIKTPTTPDKFKLTPIEDVTPPPAEKEKIPTIRRALRFDDKIPETALTSAVIEDIKPVMGGTVKRERAANSQPNSPSTASPSVKKRNLFNTPTKVS